MTHYIAKIAIITGTAVSMTGCAQMSFVGDNLWGMTKSATNFVSRPVSGLLRPAPSQNYVFEGAATPHQNISSRPSNYYHANQHQAERYQTSSLQHTSQPLYRTTHKARQAGLIPRRIVRRPYKPQENPQLRTSSYTHPKIQTQSHVENQVQNNQDISFVKIGGGSNMSDWTSCQQQSGSYYQMTKTSYRIDPNFESCMRGKGYKPESEAKAELNL